MPYTDDEINLLLADRDKRILLLTSRLNQHEKRLDELLAMIPKSKPKKEELPFISSLTDETDRIVKLRADLFDNRGKGKGYPLWNLKLFVWLNQFDKKDMTGNIAPLDGFVLQPNADGDLAGHLQLKGLKKGIDGTAPKKDHQALVIRDENRCLVRFGQWKIEFDTHEAITPEEGVSLPVARWYWNRP